MIVGKEWGGNGSLVVQGNQDVSGTSNIQTLNAQTLSTQSVKGNMITDGRFISFIPGRNYPGCDYERIQSVPDKTSCLTQCGAKYGAKLGKTVYDAVGKNCWCKWDGCGADDNAAVDAYVIH